jgi:hypothetical protein
MFQGEHNKDHPWISYKFDHLSWCDYRRTGYPLLKTNSPAAGNDQILPTRMRYPSTEAFQNAKWYSEAVNSWLGGDNNMVTDMWWASTTESQANRRLGRQ